MNRTTGEILEKEQYDEKRDERLENIRKSVKSMKVVEDLDKIYDSKDSVVYTYQWIFTDRPDKTRKNLAKKNIMLDKPYPIKKEKTLDGGIIDIEDLKGKPTLVNLWFTGCAPCIEEMPALNNLKQNYGDKFNFVAVTFDSEEKVRKLFEKYNFDFDHIVGSKKLTTKFGFNSFPTNLILDKDGIIKNIEGNVNFTINDGKMVMGDGMELIELLEKQL